MRKNIKQFIGGVIAALIIGGLWLTKPTAVCDPESEKYNRYACNALQKD